MSKFYFRLKEDIEQQEAEIKRLHSKLVEKDTEIESKKFEVDGLLIELKAKQNMIEKEGKRVFELKELLESSKSEKETTEKSSQRQLADTQIKISELNSEISDLKINMEMENAKFDKEKE